MKKLALLLTIMITFSAFAQEKKYKFRSVNSVGFTLGQSAPGLVLQTVNGITFSDWFAGIGVGYDEYAYKSLPVFADARYYFGDRKRGFLYGNLGYHFPLKNKPKQEIMYDTYDFEGGLYTDFGIGFKTKFINTSSLLFSIGHSYKRMETYLGIQNECIGCEPYYSIYDYGYGRLMFKAGFEF